MVKNITAKDPSYTAWENFCKASRGRWTVDPIHNGQNGARLLMFRGYATGEGDEGSGVYIELEFNKTGGAAVRAGSYDGAFPHIGDACFKVRWVKHFTSAESAKHLVRQRTNARI
jgi:hypothetical protein